MRSSYPRRASRRQLGLLPGSPLSDGSGSPRLLRGRALPSSAGPFVLIRLLLSRARGPTSPISASLGTISTTLNTGVNTRNAEADHKGVGETAVASMSDVLATAAGVAALGVGATAAAA